MSKFKKEGKKAQPAISTASLPDIVFMLLFFFMVATTMREVTLVVQVNKPTAKEVTRLTKKSWVDYIYIGPPIDVARYGKEARIQLDDQIADPLDIPDFILTKREAKDEQIIPLVTTSLKVDESTKMGIVSQVKEQLREVDALKINYSTRVE